MNSPRVLQRRFKNRKIDMNEANHDAPYQEERIQDKSRTSTSRSLEETPRSQPSNRRISGGFFHKENERRTSVPRCVARSEVATDLTPVEEISTNKDISGDRQKEHDGIEYKLAKCCNPIYSDEVFRFLSPRKRIKIHRVDCPNAQEMFSRFGYRIIPREMERQGETMAIRLRCGDRTGRYSDRHQHHLRDRKESNVTLRS